MKKDKDIGIDRTIIRSGTLAEEVVIIDGFPGCGKTLFGPVISSLDRVELLNYAFEVEFICRLFKLGKINRDAAVSLIRMFVDHKLYQTMMGRETNFRYADLSSAFNDPKPLRYFKRIFQAGDEAVPERIQKERPILSLTTHDLLSYAEPLFEGLNTRVTFMEVVRHPLYMIIQETQNMEKLFSKVNPRDIQVYYKYKDKELPYFCIGWEELFLKSNNVDRAIFTMHECTKNSEKAKVFNKTKYQSKIITIPFEKFVLNPDSFMQKICRTLGTTHSKITEKALKKQRVPRKKVSDGIPLDVYKRYGWRPPESGLDEQGELAKRRDWAIKMGASNQAIKTLDKLCSNYEKNYL